MRNRMDASWDDLRYLLAIERAGTLSGAARALGCNQSTMTRRLAALHDRLGERLLERRGGAYVLTAAGERLRPLLVEIEERALAVERLTHGGDAGPRGVVRLTTVETIATFVLAPRLPLLEARHPGIELELDVSRRAADLSRREADVAVRLARPRQSGLVARRIGRIGIGLYAAPGYPRRRAPHRIVTGEETEDGTPEAQLLATLAGATRALRSPSWLTQTAAVEAGLGIGALPHLLALPRGLRRIGEAAAHREVWLIVHRDLQRVARVRAVLDWVTASIRPRSARPARPPGSAAG